MHRRLVWLGIGLVPMLALTLLWLTAPTGPPAVSASSAVDAGRPGDAD
jgi:hypothetical protein